MSHRDRFASLAVVVLLTTLGGCAPDGPRQLPTPRVDTTAPFNRPSTAAGGEESAPRTVDSFEERLRRRSAGTGTSRAPTTRALRTVRLTPGLVADLPRDGEWSWAQRGELALGTHASPNGPVDALILVQRLRAGEIRDSLNGDRFRLTVDPSLASRWVELGSSSTPLAMSLSSHLSLPPHEILEALEMLRTPTLGRGLGYTSNPDSFTGWRWVGSNGRDTFLRLGATRGLWGDQGKVPAAVAQVLAALGLEAPGSGGSPWSTSAATGAETPARMILGTANRDGQGGAHLALLCRLQPDCATAEELSSWLDSIRPPEAGILDSEGSDLRTLALRAGLSLHPADERLSIAELQAAATALTPAPTVDEPRPEDEAEEEPGR